MNAEQRAHIDRAWQQVFIARGELEVAEQRVRLGTNYAADPAKNARLVDRVRRAERRVRAAKDFVEELVRMVAAEDVDELINAYQRGRLEAGGKETT